ncbi:MAG: polysaccharide deacetylase family protein [Rhodospirillales bacterium]
MLIAANFHYVRPSFAAPFPSIFGVTPDDFRRQLEALGRAGEFVGAAQIAAAIDGVKKLPPSAIAITFDDGLAEQYTAAWPVLQDMGIPAVFYVNTRCIAEATVETVHKIHLMRAQVAPATILARLDQFATEHGIDLAAIDTANATKQYKYDSPDNARLKYLLNFGLSAHQQAAFVDKVLHAELAFDEAAASRALYMTPRQVRELDAQAAIGSHAHSHVVLGQLPDAAADYQVRRSMELLSGWDCRNVISFSYPYGSLEACSRAAADSAATCGLRFAFTMERAGNADLRQPMFLARFANNDLPGGGSAQWSGDALFSQAPAARWHRSP